MDSLMKHRGLAGMLCAILTVLLHVALVGAVLGGSAGAHSRLPVIPGLGTSALASDVEPVMTLILLDATGIDAKREQADDTPASHGENFPHPFLKVMDPKPQKDAAVAREDKKDRSESTDAAASDHLGQAALFGRYMNQIQARVERAWRRPRAPIGAESFECRVQVRQSPRGEVLEVDLQDCNGDALWQLSLVRAIESASPLPAPPDPVVFTELLRLSFHSRAYAEGGDEEGFEFSAAPIVQGFR